MSRKFWDYWRKFSLSGKVVEPLRALRLSFHLYSFSCIVNTPFLPSHTLSLLLALPVDFILVFFLARQYPRGTRVRYILLLMIVVSISVIHGMVDSWCDGLRPVCRFQCQKKRQKKEAYHGYPRHVIRPCAAITGSSPIGQITKSSGLHSWK